MSDATPEGAQGWRRLFKFGPQQSGRAVGLGDIAKVVEARPRQDAASAVPPGLDRDQVTAVVSLIDALQGYSEAVVRLGPLIVTKCGVQLRAYHLTEDEAMHLQRHPEALESAAELIGLFDELRDGREVPPDGPRKGRHRRL
ncbi:hypothetical protein [Glycomyces rhizosphaerae]|uniref:Uncharacterized protein n=1 Tax=Glycomyces rhizosphaerae TaxID=2054422 RepID=A0ABV7Q0V2_9ACTN